MEVALHQRRTARFVRVMVTHNAEQEYPVEEIPREKCMNKKQECESLHKRSIGKRIGVMTEYPLDEFTSPMLEECEDIRAFGTWRSQLRHGAIGKQQD